MLACCLSAELKDQSHVPFPTVALSLHYCMDFDNEKVVLEFKPVSDFSQKAKWLLHAVGKGLLKTYIFCSSISYIFH